jgi:hypothetical protein
MKSAEATCLNRLFRRCEGAYSQITLRGYRNDLEVFKRWCELESVSWLPASSDAARFVDEQAPSKQFRCHLSGGLPSGPSDNTLSHLANMARAALPTAATEWLWQRADLTAAFFRIRR